MRKPLYLLLLVSISACNSAAQRDAEHYASDNAIHAECEKLGYVEGTTPFRACRQRLIEHLDHTPYAPNRHSHPPRTR